MVHLPDYLCVKYMVSFSGCHDDQVFSFPVFDDTCFWRCCQFPQLNFWNLATFHTETSVSMNTIFNCVNVNYMLLRNNLKMIYTSTGKWIFSTSPWFKSCSWFVLREWWRKFWCCLFSLCILWLAFWFRNPVLNCVCIILC